MFAIYTYAMEKRQPILIHCGRISSLRGQLKVLGCPHRIHIHKVSEL